MEVSQLVEKLPARWKEQCVILPLEMLNHDAGGQTGPGIRQAAPQDPMGALELRNKLKADAALEVRAQQPLGTGEGRIPSVYL
jgi:hypothetical protein